MNRFKSFWRTSTYLALVVTLLAIVAFLGLIRFAPPAPGVVVTGSRLSPEWYNGLQALIAAILSIGVISVLYEAFLRQAYGQDLAKYLNLKSSMVATGLQDLVSTENITWTSVLSGSNEVRAVLRDPIEWVAAHVGDIFSAAERRKVLIVIAVPDEYDPEFDGVARAYGTTSAALRTSLANAVTLIESAWDRQGALLASGSKIRVVSYNWVSGYEIVAADDHVVVMLPTAKPGGAGRSLGAIFDTRGGSAYPGSWIRDQATSPFAHLTSIWEREAP